MTPQKSCIKSFDQGNINTTQKALGLLDGLLATDGDINTSGDHPQIRWTTCSSNLAHNIRLTLLSLGMHGKIYEKNSDGGKVNGRKVERAHQTYTVYLSGTSLRKYVFLSKLENLHPRKGKELKRVVSQNRAVGGTWKTKIKKIEKIGNSETVYDLYCKESDTWITKGYVSRGCGEQVLGDWGVCNLGAVNLVEVMDNDGIIDWEKLKFAVRQGVKFLDTVIDHNTFIVDQTKEKEKKIRRVGLGTMGLADALLIKGIKYGSKESLNFIDEIYSFIRNEAYKMSAKLARKRGSAPGYYEDQFLDTPFIKRLPDEVRDKIKQSGIRNLNLLTQAPTGTTSILAGVSSGIEPVFALEYNRSDGMGENTVKHWLVDKIEDEGQFTTARELDPSEHVNAQSHVQQFVDSSISKTINASEDHTVEGVKDTFMKAYNEGCKGVTYYREGSREGVMEEKEEDNEETCPECGAELNMEEGCMKCPSCGWSKCDSSDQLAV